MDAEQAQAPTPGKRGGNIEPNKAAAAASASQQRLPKARPGERYELVDPFAETIHHEKSMKAMAAKALELGSIRFTAVDAQGRRSFLEHQEGSWKRTAPLTAEPSKQPPREHGDQARLEFGTPQPTPASRAPAAREEHEAHEARVAQLEAALGERYLIRRAPAIGELRIGQTEYRFRDDTSRVAFTESTFRLATETNSPSVARSMVDVAEARGWRSLRISGNEDFRRMVWQEASLRGVRTLGYEPSAGDLDQLRKEQQARQLNRIEPSPALRPAATASGDASQRGANGRGGSGRKAVLAAVEAVLVAKGVPEHRREAVMAAAAEQLAQRQQKGQALKVRVYDKTAYPQRSTPVPLREPEIARERAAPAR